MPLSDVLIYAFSCCGNRVRAGWRCSRSLWGHFDSCVLCELPPVEQVLLCFGFISKEREREMTQKEDDVGHPGDPGPAATCCGCVFFHFKSLSGLNKSKRMCLVDYKRIYVVHHVEEAPRRD